ncbi:fatty-acid--CoA ligase [Prevotella histicola]|uniref:fatty-acid--CoA ligase n=1 Tax=Prevotella histicola TaxID=470565 RepID=UPI0028E9EF72|nr:fatty-acid--CoA ligase [Prevotella histicola]
MKQIKKQKPFYQQPECRILAIEVEKFICVSVTLNPPGSSEENWDNDNRADADHEEWFGSSTEVAP